MKSTILKQADHKGSPIIEYIDSRISRSVHHVPLLLGHPRRSDRTKVLEPLSIPPKLQDNPPEFRLRVRTSRAVMSCRIVVKSAHGSEASWKASWGVAAVQTGQSFQSSDVIFQKDSVPANFALCDGSSRVYFESTGGSRTELQVADLGHHSALEFLFDTLEVTALETAQKGQDHQTAVKLVAPAEKGNLIRADILRQRLQDLEYIDKTATFAQPLQQYDGQSWTATTSLVTLIQTSAGAIRIRVTPDMCTGEALLALEGELHNRLPSPLAIPGLRRRTLAFLEGSELLPDTGGCSTQFYSAAASLGIDVVVLGVQGHWLQSAKYRCWYKAFIPIEFGHDADFPSRIVAGVRKYPEPVEALLTCFDSYHVAVSQAAIELGLPHEPTPAYEKATDKFQLSAFEGRACFVAASVQDAVKIAQTEDLPWPVIIKPCRGWGSELVFRVDSSEELAVRANRMNSTSHGTNFVIEPYCDGPEVDINFVLYDGELLFWGLFSILLLYSQEQKLTFSRNRRRESQKRRKRI